ncbi:hypothetical protein RHMOL_Rhmol04G0254100 [Rhododendron molle]|uniref:Uncharacterized protein n=1 Tax=Rhododendron molle TaxID=49168 RepID=A0ACC0P5J6_RHOML|nr:hypothetical protein RHMOL_Rhmol04G0254100 [Rhododendron molle]
MTNQLIHSFHKDKIVNSHAIDVCIKGALKLRLCFIFKYNQDMHTKGKHTMEAVCSKLVAMALGFVLAVALVAGPAEARMLERVRFGMLSKGFVPPSGPSYTYSPPPPTRQRLLHFGMLPKGIVPPSGPSWRYSYSPPPPGRQHSLHFGMLPKGVILRPSGPSIKSNILSPPPPHH